MNVLVLNNAVPFGRGGAEELADNLVAQLNATPGITSELVRLPFSWTPSERLIEEMLIARQIRIEKTDRVIGLKFPAYLVPHGDKVLWLLHQHREVYDLWESGLTGLRGEPDGAHVRQLVHDADTRMIAEARAVYTISRTVSARLQAFNGIASRPLYHPPPGAEALAALVPADGRYLLMPSRLNRAKRQGLVLGALARTTQPVRVVFMGAADDPAHAEALRLAAAPLGDRAVWTGAVPDHERLRLYAACRAVLFPPLEEDYGYVTLEAMLARKPVVTCTDSGGPLEFVQDGATGLIVAPTEQALADAMDRIWAGPDAARRMGDAGRERYDAMAIGWQEVLSCLLG